MKKLISALRLLLLNPKRFVCRVHHEFLAPATWYTRTLRSIYTTFVPNKSSSLEANDDRLLFVYDTLLSPITFDFLHYLYCADWLRQKSGLAIIDIFFVIRDETVSNHERHYLAAIGDDNIRWRLTNLLLPITRLFASVSRVYMVDECEAFELVKRYRNVHPRGYSYASPKTAICRLDQPGLVYQSALTICNTAKSIILSYFPLTDARKLVTITLRTYDYIECRNSDVSSWVEFANELDIFEYRIIFVPDASTNGVATIREIEKYEVFDSACWNLELRAALYQRAWMNIGVACGPLAISALMEKVRTVMIDRSLDYPKDYYRNVYSTGVIPGRVLNFYSNSCRIVLGRDNRQTIVDIFNECVEESKWSL